MQTVVAITIISLLLVCQAKFQKDIVIPDYSSKKEDLYLCVPVKIDKPSTLVNVQANAEQEVVHHILLYGCEEPRYKRETFECQMTRECRGPESQILFGWGKNAKGLQFPESVGIPVGPGSTVNYIVAQVHYLNGRPDNDTTSLSLRLDEQPADEAAGVLLYASNFKLPPKKKEILVHNKLCYSGYQKLTAFAARVHTHWLGQEVYFGKGPDFKKLYGRDPQLPQAFVTLPETIDIYPGDTIRATCNFSTLGETRTVAAGATHKDEMCNMYIMVHSPMQTFYEALQGYYGSVRSDPLLKSHGLMTVLHEALIPFVPCTTPSIVHYRKPQSQEQNKVVKVKQNNGELPLFVQSAKDVKSTCCVRHGKGGHVAGEVVQENSAGGGGKQCRDVLHDVEGAGGMQRLRYERDEWVLQESEIKNARKLMTFQVSSLHMDFDNTMWVLHRGTREFNVQFPSYETNYGTGIEEDVLLRIDPDSGEVVQALGSGLFDIPHGVYSDREHVWVTDVGLQQVLRIDKGSGEVTWRFGTLRKPGGDLEHLCAPTNVVTDTQGHVYIANGYCNHRVLKVHIESKEVVKEFNIPQRPNVGVNLKHWLKSLKTNIVVHDVIINECSNKLYVADRERSLVHVFDINQGNLMTTTVLSKYGIVWAIHPGFSGQPILLTQKREKSQVYAVQLSESDSVHSAWQLPDAGAVHDFTVGASTRSMPVAGGAVPVIYVAETPMEFMASHGRVLRYVMLSGKHENAQVQLQSELAALAASQADSEGALKVVQGEGRGEGGVAEWVAADEEVVKDSAIDSALVTKLMTHAAEEADAEARKRAKDNPRVSTTSQLRDAARFESERGGLSWLWLLGSTGIILLPISVWFMARQKKRKPVQAYDQF